MDHAAHQRCSTVHGESQARTARSARGQDGAGGGTAAPEPPLSASGFRLRRCSPAWCGVVTEPGGPAPGVVAAYKNLARVERGFRSIKSGDLDLRPVFHHLKKRVRVHVLICMLACCLTWHLRIVWAPLTFTDQGRAGRDNPVAPARRSGGAQTKASSAARPAGRPCRSFRDLLATWPP